MIRDLLEPHILNLERLEIDPSWIQHIDLWPREARITVYTADSNGHKHVGPDTQPATATLIERLQTPVFSTDTPR